MKRVFDFLVALLALLILAIPILLIALLVCLKLGRPIFFCQSRPGKDGVPFTMYKFRTMLNEVGPDGNLLSDSERLPAFGRKLRSTSLDELPELLNVLRGEMSLVGPRPLLMEYLPFYSPEQARRHDVLPGVTGWAQINGRNSVSWEEKFKLDVWYVQNRTFLLDLKILCATVGKVFLREGITAVGEATAARFSPENMRDGNVH